MYKNRILSRSIILDPVNDRIEQLRYDNHMQSLSKISQGVLSRTLVFDSRVRDDYLGQIKKAKKSTTYAQGLFDDKIMENCNLVKRMSDILRRKNQYQPQEKKLPSIYRKAVSEDKQMKKENKKMVERILQQRMAKSKEQIKEECKVYEKYKSNIRKIKGKQNSFCKLKLVR